MTQALATYQSLSRLGHELVGVVAGRNSNRSLPAFFERALPVPIVSVESPGFVFRAGRSVHLGATLVRSVSHLGRYRKGIRTLRAAVAAARPDLIVNFFEPLTGLAQIVRPLPAPVLSIGHQFMISHPAYVRDPGAGLDRQGLRLFAALVGLRSWKLALSLTPEPDLPARRLTVGPPLLRRELFGLVPGPGEYVVMYVLNHAYAGEITAWHREHPGVSLHCFYDRPGAPEAEQVSPNLTFHRLDGAKFLQMMAGCRAAVCTAGFESVCEAAWLGKPLLVVPVEGHAEQRLNALDTVRAGFGQTDRCFNLDRLAGLPRTVDNVAYRAWVRTADLALERAIGQAMRRRDPARGAVVTAGQSLPAGIAE